MTSDEEILDSIRQDSDLAELLWHVCEFDLSRGEHGEPVRLSSGMALDAVAGDFTGGTLFLCGARSGSRPVLYAGSEGQAGLIGRSLSEALAIMVGLPSWWDCLKFSGSGDLTVMQTTLNHLHHDKSREQPEMSADRVRLARALAVEPGSDQALLTRLHAVVSTTAPDFVLTTEAGEEYESLFGPWLPGRNPSWR